VIITIKNNDDDINSCDINIDDNNKYSSNNNKKKNNNNNDHDNGTYNNINIDDNCNSSAQFAVYCPLWALLPSRFCSW